MSEIKRLLEEKEELELANEKLLEEIDRLESKVSDLEDDIEQLNIDVSNAVSDAESWQEASDYWESHYDDATFFLKEWEKITEETGYEAADVLAWFKDIKAQAELRAALMKEQGINIEGPKSD